MSGHGGFWWFRKDDSGHGLDVGRGRGCVDASRQMAGHTSSRTTKMYVRIEEQMRQEEVERVRI